MAPSDLSLWSEITPPPVREDSRFSNVSWAQQQWRVLLSDDGKPSVQPVDFESPPPKPTPSFVPKASKWIAGAQRHYKFVGGQAYLPTDDGWLVAFNRGEFGAALYWYDKTGKSSYKISDHQVVAFVSNTKGIFAVEGLSHLGLNHGSIIRISRAHQASSWRAETFAKLPSCPEAAASSKDGTLYVALSDRLLAVTPKGEMTSLMQGDFLLGGQANSALLSSDESTLYVGMTQFVLKVNVKTRQQRYLLPDAALLQKLTSP
ncbi:hypothetical protein [Roseimicrobium gellanilyticum]|nr:hypothetical protein [Roseimicrobium gellanilyticum]